MSFRILNVLPGERVGLFIFLNLYTTVCQYGRATVSLTGTRTVYVAPVKLFQCLNHQGMFVFFTRIAIAFCIQVNLKSKNDKNLH